MYKGHKNTKLRLLVFLVLSVFFYRIILGLVYSRIIYPQFNYMYYAKSFDNEYSLLKDVISWLLLIPIPFIIFRNIRKGTFSRQVWTLLLAVAYIPSTVMYVYNDFRFYGWYVLYLFIFSIAIELINPIRIKVDGRIAKLTMEIIGAILIFSVWFIWIYYTHFRIHLSILDVYGIRAESKTYVMPTVVKYIFSMSLYVIPLYAVYNLYCKKYWKMFLYSLTQMIGFFINGSKTSFFVLVFAFATYFVLSFFKEYTKFIPGVLAIGGIIGLLENNLLGSVFFSSFFYRRVMFLPNLLNSYYFDFFTKNPYDCFRRSISILGESPYRNDIPGIIGDIYLSVGCHANNGLFSDAWANLGGIGMVIMPILLVIVLKLFDGATEGLAPKVYISAVIEVALLFIGSSFFTNLLSHGLAIMIVVLYMYKNSTESEIISIKGEPLLQSTCLRENRCNNL